MLATSIENLLLIDIETVSQFENYRSLPDTWKELWTDKIEKVLPENETPESFYPKRAAIMAEFGKIICISAGYFKYDDSKLGMRIKSFTVTMKQHYCKQYLLLSLNGKALKNQ